MPVKVKAEPEKKEAPKKVEAPKKATVADLRGLATELRADALADPGDGVLLHHLNAICSNLESLEQVDRLHEQMVRPEGE
jgi:hypothetical protein